jgi:hypothetical protein
MPFRLRYDFVFKIAAVWRSGKSVAMAGKCVTRSSHGRLCTLTVILGIAA